MSKLKGKVALVTGASKGIGASIARGLAAAGARVVVNYASSREGAEKVVADIKAAGGQAIAIGGDVSKAADVKALFAETKQAFGGLDILVNNAGIYKFQPLEEFTEDEFHRQFNTNLLAPILTTREALKLLPQGGSVINIGTVASVKSIPGSTVYAASKAGLDAVTRVLAAELGPRGIRVNAIAPGAVETEGTRSAGIVGSDFATQVVAATPLGRFGQPEDIAKVAVFLASDDAAWVTGERLTASGGF